MASETQSPPKEKVSSPASYWAMELLSQQQISELSHQELVERYEFLQKRLVKYEKADRKSARRTQQRLAARAEQARTEESLATSTATPATLPADEDETRSSSTSEPATRRPAKRKREFDFSKFHKRHIALRIAYLGANYQGLAAQDHTTDTIEGHLFRALQTTCLIVDRPSCNYSRCGRTDRGVSALGQVVALDVRTNLTHGVGVLPRDEGSIEQRHVSRGAPLQGQSEEDLGQELNFALMINRVLPDDIRVIAWAPVPREFDARFSCIFRTYKYYFVRGNMDIERMHTAAQRLVGEHDFRNFCKVDAGGNVKSFVRRILGFKVKVAEGITEAKVPALQVCEMTIIGFAFLWHQVRCMASVLFMIGAGEENMEIIDQLLDYENFHGKPQFNMASELPLVLYDCGYESVKWIYEPGTHLRLLQTMTALWTEKTMAAAVVRGMMHEMRAISLPRHVAQLFVQPTKAFTRWTDVEAFVPDKRAPHKPLVARVREEDPEKRLQYAAKRPRKQAGPHNAALGAPAPAPLRTLPAADVSSSVPSVDP
eukprot:m.595936 g.595936  ORF g.595936 m.595936 type:complete len:541 (-) comp58043_c0_seq27:51-1673(-)